MKSITLISGIALLLFISIACKATKKAYEKGDYTTAVFNSIDKLRKSPNNKKATQTLKLAYPSLVDYKIEQATFAKNSSDPYKWETVLGNYDVLNRVYDEVQRAPAAKRAIPRVRYFGSEYNDALLKAAEARYAMGVEDLEVGREGDRERAKSAFYHFEKANALKSGYRDSERLLEESRELATLFVRIESIPMHSRTLSLSNEFFENQMAEFIRSHPTSPFIQFIPPGERVSSNFRPDHIMRMVFDDFVVGQAYVKETVVQRVKDSVVVGSVKVNRDSTADVYGTVKAEVHQFQKEISSSGLLDFQIIETRSNRLLTQRKFPGTFIWYDYWGFFNGDERALEDEDKKFVKSRREAPNPLPQDLFIEFTKPIFDQVTGFVAEYYRGY